MRRSPRSAQTARLSKKGARERRSAPDWSTRRRGVEVWPLSSPLRRTSTRARLNAETPGGSQRVLDCASDPRAGWGAGRLALPHAEKERREGVASVVVFFAVGFVFSHADRGTARRNFSPCARENLERGESSAGSSLLRVVEYCGTGAANELLNKWAACWSARAVEAGTDWVDADRPPAAASLFRKNLLAKRPAPRAQGHAYL